MSLPTLSSKSLQHYKSQTGRAEDQYWNSLLVSGIHLYPKRKRMALREPRKKFQVILKFQRTNHQETTFKLNLESLQNRRAEL